MGGPYIYVGANHVPSVSLTDFIVILYRGISLEACCSSLLLGDFPTITAPKVLF